MPVYKRMKDGKPCYQWGDSGKCYPFTEGDEESEKRAKRKAVLQGQAAYASGYKSK